MRKRLRIRGFTLVEMLVVLSIIGILLGISLPAFSRLMTGQGVSGGARELGGMLSMTRAYAIGNNCCTAVIVPHDLSGTSASKLNFCAYRACVVTPKYTSGSIVANEWEFRNWVDGTKWSSLPDGVVITNTNSGTAGVVTNGDTINIASDSTFFKDLLDETASAKTVRAVVFKPSGTPSVNGGNGEYYVRAGTPNGSSIVETDPTHKNNYKLTINQYTGRLKYEQGQ